MPIARPCLVYLTVRTLSRHFPLGNSRTRCTLINLYPISLVILCFRNRMTSILLLIPPYLKLFLQACAVLTAPERNNASNLSPYIYDITITLTGLPRFAS